MDNSCYLKGDNGKGYLLSLDEMMKYLSESVGDWGLLQEHPSLPAQVHTR
jgi:hypothetical protein